MSRVNLFWVGCYIRITIIVSFFLSTKSGTYINKWWFSLICFLIILKLFLLEQCCKAQKFLKIKFPISQIWFQIYQFITLFCLILFNHLDYTYDLYNSSRKISFKIGWIKFGIITKLFIQIYVFCSNFALDPRIRCQDLGITSQFIPNLKKTDQK